MTSDFLIDVCNDLNSFMFKFYTWKKKKKIQLKERKEQISFQTSTDKVMKNKTSMETRVNWRTIECFHNTSPDLLVTVQMECYNICNVHHSYEMK